MPLRRTLSIPVLYLSMADLVAYLSAETMSFNLLRYNSTVSFRFIGYSSATLTLFSKFCCTRICPQKLNILLLMTCWNPFTKLSATIITATLSEVAPIANLIMKREKVCLFLKAILLAMNNEISNTM